MGSSTQGRPRSFQGRGFGVLFLLLLASWLSGSPHPACALALTRRPRCGGDSTLAEVNVAGKPQRKAFRVTPVVPGLQSDTFVVTRHEENGQGGDGGRWRPLAWRLSLRKTFLPQGWPASVPTEYFGYQCWHVVQDMCSQLRNALAVQRVLLGLGVGVEGATSLGAVTSWILRDGAGMVSSLLFTSMKSEAFGNDVKRWRFFADAIVDVGLFLEMLAPSFRQRPGGNLWFIGLLCMSSVAKALCGVAAGSANAAISFYFAGNPSDASRSRGVDIGEITAKSGAVGTLSGLTGLGLSLALTRMSTSTPWPWFWGLTLLHLYACRCGLRLLNLPTLSMRVLATLLGKFLAQEQGQAEEQEGQSGRGRNEVNLPTVQQFSSNDPIVQILGPNSSGGVGVGSIDRVVLGEGLSRLQSPDSPAPSPYSSSNVLCTGLSSRCLAAFGHDAFVPVIVRQGISQSRGGATDSHGAGSFTVHMLLREGSSPIDHLRAAVFGLLVVEKWQRKVTCNEDDLLALRRSFDATFMRFATCLEASGWLSASAVPVASQSPSSKAGLARHAEWNLDNVRLRVGLWRLSPCAEKKD